MNGTQVSENKTQSDSAFPRLLVLAGGGTGGHILAGIAIAEKWMERGPKALPRSVIFIGATGGMEEKLVPRSGFALKTLSIGSLNRVGWGRKIQTLGQLPLACLQSLLWLLRMKPVAVVGVGGYASGPVLVMAALLRKMQLLPTSTLIAILEQNSVPGLTNRWLARCSDRIYIAFNQTEEEFEKVKPGLGKKTRLFGNPIRSQVIPAENKSSSSTFTLFIFGGSQGAIGMNTVVMESINDLINRIPNLRIIHQTGEKDFERVKKFYHNLSEETNGASHEAHRFQVERFIYKMQECYEKADLIICRAGSGTLFEIATVGKAAIFIPLPSAADNHQEKNAAEFASAKAGWVVSQSDSQGCINGKELTQLVISLFEKRDLIEEASKNVRKFARPTASSAIVDDLLKESLQK